MKTDREIALEHATAGTVYANLGWTLDDVLACMAAARADERAECVRLLREECPARLESRYFAAWLDALEAHKP